MNDVRFLIGASMVGLGAAMLLGALTRSPWAAAALLAVAVIIMARVFMGGRDEEP